jgi:hypothetical protein
LLAGIAAGGVLAACQGQDAEFRQALPEKSDVMVDLPGADGSSSQGLTAASGKLGTSKQAVVGTPAEFYTDSYYISRDLNTLGAFIVDILKAVTATKPSGLTATNAVWGPLSQPLEPNEYILNVDKKTDVPLHYVWKLEGKPKSLGADAYVILAGGSYEPAANPDQGKLWFAIEFDNIHTLNPTDNSKGRIEYAINRNDSGTLVFAHYVGPADDGSPTEAFYAYGVDNASAGFMVFAFQADIDNGMDGSNVKEDVLIHSRWQATGAGRADIFATKGTLGASVVIGSQCWGKSFVSSFEDFALDGKVLATSGDASTCVFGDQKVPAKTDLPTAQETLNPHPVEGMVQ